MGIKRVDEIALKGSRVFVRVDYNVPLDAGGKVVDDHRIRASLPTVEHCLGEGAALVLASHLGRPKGKRVESLSLAPVARALGELVGRPVNLAADCIGEEVRRQAAALGPGEILLLENVRFHPGEEANDPQFARELASLAPVYVNDAFAVSHRAHASVAGITRHVGQCAAGFLLAQELEYFRRTMEDPARPLVAVLGGAKVSTKLPVLKQFAARVDRLILGGALANTFLKAAGVEVGASMVEEDLLAEAREVLDFARERGVEVVLPVDFVAAERLEAGAPTREVTPEEIPPTWAAFDIGPESRKRFAAALEGAKTIVWNGPMGAFETPGFDAGTMAMAAAIAASDALSVVGGGDTDLALERAGQKDQVSYISTGGGAFLELFQGRALPGVEALKECGQGD